MGNCTCLYEQYDIKYLFMIYVVCNIIFHFNIIIIHEELNIYPIATDFTVNRHNSLDYQSNQHGQINLNPSLLSTLLLLHHPYQHKVFFNT